MAVRSFMLTRAVALLGIATAAGCASMYQPVNQELAVRPTWDGARIEANCQLANDQARWSVNAPANVAVTRSGGALTVECRGPDGLSGTASFQARRDSNLGGDAAYAYPERIEIPLKRQGPQRRATAQASVHSITSSQLPHVDEAGRQGFERFVAGPSPRAFAISERGNWSRANGARGASEVALERCQSLGGRCRLYAVDDQIVWDERPVDQAAAN